MDQKPEKDEDVTDQSVTSAHKRHSENRSVDNRLFLPKDGIDGCFKFPKLVLKDILDGDADKCITTPVQSAPVKKKPKKKFLNYKAISTKLAELKMMQEMANAHEAQKRQDTIQLLQSINSIEIYFVLIHFTTYINSLGKLFIPAEVGLTAFSIERGIVDNYWSLIDPYAIPLGYQYKARRKTERLWVKFPPFSNRFQDYETIVGNIKKFIRLYENPKTKTTLLFCRRQDSKSNKGCLDWLYDQRGENCNTELHSFEELLKILSQMGMAAQLNQEPFRITGNGCDDNSSSSSLSSEYLLWDRDCFSWRCSVGGFQNNWKLQALGLKGNIVPVFFFEKNVEDFLDCHECDFNDEVGCLYHAQPESDGIQFCPLNITNRYAYLALSVLTTQYNIDPQPGIHFYDWTTREIVRQHRKELLVQWGHDLKSSTEFTLRNRKPPPQYSTRIVDRIFPKSSYRPAD